MPNGMGKDAGMLRADQSAVGRLVVKGIEQAIERVLQVVVLIC